MKTLVENLIENQKKEKIQKPDCKTRSGRTLLAFYLKTKFKQILNHDKKSDKQIIIEYKNDFLDRFNQRLIEYPNKKILIALSGESASGKSTICKLISNAISEFNLPISLVSADNYFNDISKLIKKYGNFDLLRDSGFDVDSPENFDLIQLKEDMLKLQNGEDVLIPQYLVNGTGVSIPKSIPIKSKKIILVEGMCSTYKEVEDIFDLKIYIEINDEERKQRFINRAKSRNQDLANALKHWEYVLEAGKKYVACNRNKCDVIINGECDFEYFTNMIKYIYLITNNFSQE